MAVSPAAEGNPFEAFLKSRIRRSKPNLTGDPKGGEGIALFERKTQSPLIWLKYTKTELPEPTAGWYNTPFKDFAKQAVGALKAGSQSADANGEAEFVVKPAASAFHEGKIDAGDQASPSETAATLLMDAEMTMDHLSSLRKDIKVLKARLSAGGLSSWDAPHPVCLAFI
jgi:hypothetical protein